MNLTFKYNLFISGCRIGVIAAVILSIYNVSPCIALESHSLLSVYEAAAIKSTISPILRSQRVHRELALKSDQAKFVENCIGLIDIPLWNTRDLPADKRIPIIRQLTSQLQTKLTGRLSVRQMDRLNQILLQSLGIHGFSTSDVKTKLNLSSQQSQQIQTQLKLLEQKLAALTKQNPSQQQAKVAVKIMSTAKNDILDVLTEHQKVLLPKVIGRTFDMSAIKSYACPAPELKQVETWINSEPVKLNELRGNVVVVHFYAFGCINCIRNLPHYNNWHSDFEDDGLKIVGIHRPETQTERDIEKVKQKAVETGIKYPVAVDNDSENWDAWQNNIWPSVYLIDKEGFIRHWWYGELNWNGIEGEQWFRSRITELLKE